MKSNHVAVFFMFNTVIIALLVGSSKPSEGDHDRFMSSLPFPLLPPVYEEVDDTGKELSNDESDENGESHGFSLSLSVWVSLPSLAYEVEDKEEEESNDEDSTDDEYHGFDGYEEDNEGGFCCSEDEDEEEEEEEEDDSDVDEEEKRDLERRIQEFIDKVYRKWGEELYNERLLCLPAPVPHFSSSTYLSPNAFTYNLSS